MLKTNLLKRRSSKCFPSVTFVVCNTSSDHVSRSRGWWQEGRHGGAWRRHKDAQLHTHRITAKSYAAFATAILSTIKLPIHQHRENYYHQYEHNEFYSHAFHFVFWFYLFWWRDVCNTLIYTIEDNKLQFSQRYLWNVIDYCVDMIFNY